MQRPYDALFSLFDPPEEKRQIEKPAMKIMQMNHIRVDPLQLPDKPERREKREAPMQARIVCQPDMNFQAKLASHPVIIGNPGCVVSIPFLSKHMNLMTSARSAFQRSDHDLSRAPDRPRANRTNNHSCTPRLWELLYL